MQLDREDAMILILSSSIWMDGTRPRACLPSAGITIERIKKGVRLSQSDSAEFPLAIEDHSNFKNWDSVH